MQILVVEDESLIAELMVECLQEAGHTILGPAATAQKALRLCQDCTPDLAILDISLRDGSSGLEVAQELFHRRGVATIFASGELMATRQVQDVALGFLRKPYEVPALLESVALIGSMRSGQGPRQAPPVFEPFARLCDALPGIRLSPTPL